MKRLICLLLSAVFLSVLCIPCAARDTGRKYSGFSDVGEKSASYAAIKLCYEQGLMNGKSKERFDPEGDLTLGQLLVLGARLYDIQNGGDGVVPDLPDWNEPYLRIYDEEGNTIAEWTLDDERSPNFNADLSTYIRLSSEEDNTSLPEKCKMEIGFEKFGKAGPFEGVRQSYHSEPGYMDQGYSGTGYYFENPEASSFTRFFALSNTEEVREAWWFPAYFYLIHEVPDFWGQFTDQVNIDKETVETVLNSHADLNTYCYRAFFAWLVDLTAGEMEILNFSPVVPDLEQSRNQESVLRLYQAGILTGVDQTGNFNGRGSLTRGQTAIMMARVLEPALRVKMG